MRSLWWPAAHFANSQQGWLALRQEQRAPEQAVHELQPIALLADLGRTVRVHHRVVAIGERQDRQTGAVAQRPLVLADMRLSL